MRKISGMSRCFSIVFSSTWCHDFPRLLRFTIIELYGKVAKYGKERSKRDYDILHPALSREGSNECLQHKGAVQLPDDTTGDG